MDRYPALEGLRAWLAWAVVASHVMQASELYETSHLAAWLFDFGERAVEVFIILSGFVVTHLLLSRQETYASYLRRRAFRLLPAFIVACLVGAAAVSIAAHALGPATAQSEWARHAQALAAAQAEHPWAHALLHLTMLHGLVPNTVLPMSQYAFTPPGWSLSLEWQFYLLAPGVVWLWRRRWGPVLVTAAALAMYAAYAAVTAAHPQLWTNPSLLPGAAPFFLVGVASRFAAPRCAGTIAHPLALAALAFAALTALGLIALGLWAAMLAVLWARRDGAGRIDAAALALADHALCSPAAQYFGARSYSVYLIHVPILMLASAAIGGFAQMEAHHKAYLLAAVAIPASVVAAHVLYAAVERPMIALGARRPAPRALVAA